MNTAKKAKEIKLKPSGNVLRSPLEELSDIHRESIFNHEDCKKSFDDKIKDVKLPVSSNTIIIIGAFAAVFPKLTDRQLNLSDVEGEYEQLTDLLTVPRTQGIYPTHPGIFNMMVTTLRQQPGENYQANTPDQRREIFIAGREVLKEVNALAIPIRDECIANFYENATQDQLDDIRIQVKHRENPQKQGMPGNQGVPQFRM